MIKVGLISDTHGYMDPRVSGFLKDSELLLHAGDIGSLDVWNELSTYPDSKMVFGNIDGTDIRMRTKEEEFFSIEDVRVFLTHIGGYPGHYEKKIREKLKILQPDLFICGHSHILRIIYDKQFSFLHLNPGAAGKNGFHHVQTALRFVIDKDQIKQMEILELPRNNQSRYGSSSPSLPED